MTVEGTAAAPSPTDVAPRRLFGVTGIAGLAAIVLIVAVVVGTRQEPTFNATATDVLSGGRLPATGGRSIGREDEVDLGKPPPA